MFSVFDSFSKPPKDVTDDVADTGWPEFHLSAPQVTNSVPKWRPQIQRQQTLPLHQPPPPPISSQQNSYSDNSNDALSLMQLRRIVNEFPKSDSTHFAFTYNDSASFEEEINEWFAFNDTEYRRLLLVKEKFERRWKKFGSKSWLESETSEHERFLEREIVGLLASNFRRRCKSLQTILHVTLGVWDVTAQADFLTESTETKSKVSKQHLEHMKRGITLVAEFGGIPILFDILKNSLNKLGNDECPEYALQENELPYYQIEIDSVTTILYVIIEGVRNYTHELELAHESLTRIAPDILDYFLKKTASLRWDESHHWPQTKILLLLWKSILLVFGGVAEADALKRAVSECKQEEEEKIITASPLDYHIFRQEIISKYPAYDPPPALLPLEPHEHSIVPPLLSLKRRTNISDGLIPPSLDISSSGTSILHQSVHIATPAPSPPPSPPVGGKAGKKQNYQTNQNFPFLYPPLDNRSSSAGGKGIAGLQEHLVGRNWVGSHIPKSILEAGDIFAQRMRMTRSLRQLWEEREKYAKFERGWDIDDDNDDDEIEELDLDSTIINDISNNKTLGTSVTNPKPPKLDYGPNEEVSDEIRQKLESIEKFYKYSLPHLQSLIIVLLKAVVTSITSFFTQPTGPYHGTSAAVKELNLHVNGLHAQHRYKDPSTIPLPDTDISGFLIEELETLRSREITIKAVSGILILLLKWFKVSHVLKFEYMTQLLLDSNYLPLVLKVFAHQDTDKSINNRTDSDDMSFFAFCNANSINCPAEQDIPVSPILEDSEDEAVPPPIKISSNQNFSMETQYFLPAVKFEDEQDQGRSQIPQNPEIPDTGHLKTESYLDQVSEFPWRSLFSTINLLRVMQKICKNKTHRNLLLVQYKSSQILKKLLRIPQSDVRIYTLKLFKNQVPYYGRKWRQGNMRVITAIYLHCRPELRDDWLAGCDLSFDVEDALPIEQALRSLTHWHNIKYYSEQMGVSTKLLGSEHDFFAHELEKMEIFFETLGDGNIDTKSNWECVSNDG